MFRAVERPRISQAATDERCIHMGVQWVRARYKLHNDEAHTAIAAARHRAGSRRTDALLASRRRARLFALLMEAEGRWPGVLDALRTDPYRAVAERFGVAITCIWRVRERMQELAEMMGASAEDVAQAVANDLR